MNKLVKFLTYFPLILLSSNAYAEGVIQVPVRLNFIQSESYEPLTVDESDQNLSEVFGVVNRIWSRAGIQFYLEKKQIFSAAKVFQYKSALNKETATKAQKVVALRNVCPLSQRGNHGIDICVVGNTFHPGFGGVAFTSKKLSPLVVWPVEVNGVSNPNPATLAHEIGHALGLKHNTEVDVYLMRGDGNNIRRPGGYEKIVFLDREVVAARKAAMTLSKK